MDIVWDQKPSKEIKELSIENMRRLVLVLADMCYIALNVFEQNRGRKPSKAEAIKIIENELDLVVEQNIRDDDWREIVHNLAIEKYERVSNLPDKLIK